jgi:hypothetical protein
MLQLPLEHYGSNILEVVAPPGALCTQLNCNKFLVFTVVNLTCWA